MKIKFGTDGWNGIISRDFTFENLTLVAQALASYLLENGEVAGGVVVGYDTRFLSDHYALEVAKVLAGNGIRTFLANKPVVTPVVSYAVRHLGAKGGVMITASHNPYQYNGLKIKGSYGGPALPEMIEEVESYIGRKIKMTTPDDELIINFNPDELYFKGVAEMVDLEMIRRAGLKVIVDVMHGSARGYLRYLLQGECSHIIEIRNSMNPSFGGSSPEPVAQNLNSLVNVLLGFNADLAIAIDGDGDRIGIIDSRGQYVDAHHIFTLLLRHLVENHKNDGGVVKTFSTTQMINKMAEHYHLKVFETQIGFKYICDIFLHEKILMGGEESGGFGFQKFLPERDAILSSLFLLEMLVVSGLTVRELLNRIEEEIGKFVYRRVDVKLPEIRSTFSATGQQKKLPTEIAGIPIEEVQDLDGLKFRLKNGSWLLVRPSKNEPLMRYYAEGHSQEEVEKILQGAISLGIM